MADIYPARRWQVTVQGYYPPKTAPKPHRKKPLVKGEFYPPKHEIQAFARCILPAIQAYFESEKGKKEYAEWCEKRRTENKTA
jgi:hypothetical protein